eukprot:TRINITY_DN67248_c5_g3_i1.p1 TRINITY_DN67248_c5_g3~~TRINITY_DN67248_c5_g3_i1.p1  ORF type:complete len:295 (-),score=40.54 TRINITY_DN67248_c5_g3_i1:155-1012(-)
MSVLSLAVLSVIVCSTVWSATLHLVFDDSEDPQPCVNDCVPKPREYPIHYTYKIINTYPHDQNSFTQGLLYDPDQTDILYESAGLYRRSDIRRQQLKTGKVEKKQKMADKYFGEGMCLWENQLMQITWREHTGFIYDKDTFNIIGNWTHATEGWGITHDGKELMMSDGSHQIYFMNPAEPQTILRTIQVVDKHGKPQRELNELEYIEGEIWANVWQQKHILRIRPTDGTVLGIIDFAGLYQEGLNWGHDVLNGIAYDAKTKRIFVTGKRWNKLFEVEVIEKKKHT